MVKPVIVKVRDLILRIRQTWGLHSILTLPAGGNLGESLHRYRDYPVGKLRKASLPQREQDDIDMSPTFEALAVAKEKPVLEPGT